MNAVIFILTALEVIVSILLIGIIVIQQSKASGGLGTIGGAMTESVFGASAGNVITKATVVLAACFLSITLLLAIITGHRQLEGGTSAAERAGVPTPVSVPEGGAPATGGGEGEAGTGGAGGANEDGSDADPAETPGTGAPETETDTDGADAGEQTPAGDATPETPAETPAAQEAPAEGAAAGAEEADAATPAPAPVAE